MDKTFTTTDLKKDRGPGNVSDETYGKQSFLYVGCGSKERRAELERKLRGEDTAYPRRHNPRGNAVEVQVSYFKSWLCDE